MAERRVKKVKAGVEDMAIGFSQVTQSRNGVNVPVTEFSLSTLAEAITFKTGATLEKETHSLRWSLVNGGDGRDYYWTGAFPKEVPPDSTPENTGGIGEGAWRAVGFYRSEPVVFEVLGEEVNTDPDKLLTLPFSYTPGNKQLQVYINGNFVSSSSLTSTNESSTPDYEEYSSTQIKILTTIEDDAIVKVVTNAVVPDAVSEVIKASLVELDEAIPGLTAVNAQQAFEEIASKLNTVGGALYVPFIVNDATEATAIENKTLLDNAIVEAQTNNLPVIMPTTAGVITIKGSTYLPDTISLGGYGKGITVYEPYDTGTITDYAYAYTDGLSLEALFFTGTSDTTLLPPINDINTSSRFIQYQNQVDTIISEGDIVAIHNTDDYSWGNFRRVDDGSGNIDYTASTNGDDRPYYHQGEFVYARTITAPTASYPTLPNAMFLTGSTYDSYTLGSNIESRIVHTHVNHLFDCTIRGLKGQSVSPLVMRQNRHSLLNIDLEYGKTNLPLINCVQCGGNLSTKQPETTTDSEEYGLVYFSSMDCVFRGEFSANRHAVSHSASFGIPIPTRKCVTLGTYTSYRSYAVDFHGASEANQVIGICDGGIVWGGINNDVSQLNIKPNSDGTAVFMSEIPTWNNNLHIGTLQSNGGFTSVNGLIHAGATSLRGFTANVAESGHFSFTVDSLILNKLEEGRCDFPDSGITQSECENAGGYWNPDTNVCTLSDLGDYEQQDAASCNLISGATWVKYGYNIINFRVRNPRAQLNMTIDIKSVVNNGVPYRLGFYMDLLEESATYNNEPVVRMGSVTVKNFYSELGGGLNLSSIDDLYIEEAYSNDGTWGIRGEGLKNVTLGKVKVKQTSFQGIYLVGDNTGILTIHDVEALDCGYDLVGSTTADTGVYIDGFDVDIRGELLSRKANVGADYPVRMASNVSKVHYNRLRPVAQTSAIGYNEVLKSVYDISSVANTDWIYSGFKSQLRYPVQRDLVYGLVTTAENNTLYRFNGTGVTDNTTLTLPEPSNGSDGFSVAVIQSGETSTDNDLDVNCPNANIYYTDRNGAPQVGTSLVGSFNLPKAFTATVRYVGTNKYLFIAPFEGV